MTSTRSLSSSPIVVGISELAVGHASDSGILTYALGSCIGLTVYDPLMKVGGLLHFMLPRPPKGDLSKAASKPCMYGSKGIPMLFQELYSMGARKERMVVCAAGGAEAIENSQVFNIGERNRTVMRKLLWKNSITLAAEQTGGRVARTLGLNLEDGSVTIKSGREETLLWHP